MADHTISTETGAAMITKASPPVAVSIATVAGYSVSDLVLWATLIYTVLMICHKSYQIYKELTKD
jgi:hypothetical protein